MKSARDAPILRPVKTILSLLFASVSLSTCALADAVISKAEAASMKTLTVQDIMTKGEMMDGKVARVVFSYRDPQVSELKKGETFSSRIFPDVNCPVAGGIDVTFHQSGLSWFQKQTTDFAAKARIPVICRFVKGPAGVQLEILGRSVSAGFTETKVTW